MNLVDGVGTNADDSVRIVDNSGHIGRAARKTMIENGITNIGCVSRKRHNCKEDVKIRKKT